MDYFAVIDGGDDNANFVIEAASDADRAALHARYGAAVHGPFATLELAIAAIEAAAATPPSKRP